MMAPAVNPRNGFNYLKQDLLMKNSLSIFDVESEWLTDEVYVHGLKNEIKQIISNLGGPTKTSHLLNISYVALKEWPSGRKPISLGTLNKMLNLCSDTTREELKSKIDLQEILLSCRYSPHKIRFPKSVSPDLAYCVGMLLGDGSLAGNNSNSNGNWGVYIFLDDEEHRRIYDSVILKEFGFVPKHYMKGENCYISYFCSKAFHWFLRNYFEVGNGLKCNKIFAPKIILKHCGEVVAAFLQGLFDSDGTITKKDIVKFDSTSKIIVEQVRELLEERGIKSSFSKWLKSEKYLPLYSAVIGSKDNVLKFAKSIGFRHPKKLARLLGVKYKYLVAPSSSGQRDAVK